MARRKLLWEISYPYLILILLSLVLFGIYSIRVFENFYLSVTSDELKDRALMVRERIINSGIQNPEKDSSKINNIISGIDKITSTRITVILPSGKVISDSRENPSQMDNHSDRPEIIEALKGGTGYSSRYSHTLKENLMYTAIPLTGPDNKITGVIRTAISLEEIDSVLRKKFLEIGSAGLIILLIAVFLGVFLARKIRNPLEEMREGAENYSRGIFDKKIYPPHIEELEGLATALNTMASQVDEKLRIISEQKNIQQAVLESMKEGVLAVDNDEKILLTNKTAEDMLHLSGKDVKGKTLQEVVRISDIQKFFKKTLEEKTAQETDIVIKEQEDKILQLRGTPLFNADYRELGVLVVINDITELRHLDNLKRDFVANVSHELKTPITTIKGFIETLKEGAINEPENAQRFLEIVSKHADRLNMIIEELLSLSRLEQKSSTKELKFLEENLKPLMKSVIEDFEVKAKEKDIKINIECEDITAKLNRPLIEEALGNYIDNAIKYSEKNKNILVKTKTLNGNLIISVTDEGPGISGEHLPRLFERFYRIDKGRNRDAGGTGLGLAIVKHIAQVHNGTAEVESEEGKGSTFSLKIPLSTGDKC